MEWFQFRQKSYLLMSLMIVGKITWKLKLKVKRFQNWNHQKLKGSVFLQDERATLCFQINFPRKVQMLLKNLEAYFYQKYTGRRL